MQAANVFVRRSPKVVLLDLASVKLKRLEKQLAVVFFSNILSILPSNKLFVLALQDH